MSVERFELQAGYSISRVIKGGWHLAGGHGPIDTQTALKDMLAFVEAGITTFDCADIYTGVESLIGQFLKKHQTDFTSGNLPKVQVHTKYVPDYNALKDLSKADTTRIIDRSLKRLGVERLDLVQFAWWDYQFPRYVDTAVHLAALQKAGKIRFIGVTNFDASHLQEILDAGVKVAANQVQYSVLDRRVESKMVAQAQANNFSLLCYGAIAGGFLSDRYQGMTSPKGDLENRSLTKYRLIIEEFGTWDFFQETLSVLRKIADKHKLGIAEVAARYILQKDQVAAVIVGARNQNHLSRLSQLDTFQLDIEDIQRIDQQLTHAKGPNGPFYELERDKTGKHGSIMKYNLNTK